MQSSKAILAVAAVILVAACSDSTSTGTGSNATVQFNVATAHRPAAGVALAVTGSPDTLTDGTNELVIDSAQMVLRDIKFHLTDTTACSDNGDDGNDGADDDGTPDQGPGDNIRMSHDSAGEDDCDELHIGPYLLDLPLDDGPARSFSLEVPAGTYREVKFKVHKATRSSDASFIAAHPALEDRSVRVVGTYNGVPFVFTSDASANQESEFNPPITVDGTTATDLTLFVDISTWFVVDGALVDPSRANSEEPLASQVKNNIKASIRAFKDDDRDGEDDDNEHGGDHGGNGGDD